MLGEAGKVAGDARELIIVGVGIMKAGLPV